MHELCKNEPNMLPICDDNTRSTFMAVVRALYQRIICRTNIMLQFIVISFYPTVIWNYWTRIWCTWARVNTPHLETSIPNHELYICHNDMDVLEWLMLQMSYRLDLLLCRDNSISIFFPKSSTMEHTLAYTNGNAKGIINLELMATTILAISTRMNKVLHED